MQNIKKFVMSKETFHIMKQDFEKEECVSYNKRYVIHSDLTMQVECNIIRNTETLIKDEEVIRINKNIVVEEKSYEMEVKRKKYRHTSKQVVLMKDYVLFENEETFVQFSLIGELESILVGRDVDIHPCRSKISEYLYMVRESNDTYSKLVKNGNADSKCKSMSYAEYKFGEEKANKWKDQANDFITDMKTMNHPYTEKQVHSMYRDIKMYGYSEDENDDIFQ